MSALHYWHAFLCISLTSAVHLEFAIEPLTQPGFLELVTDGKETLVATWVADIRKRRHDPVCTLPLGVNPRTNLPIGSAAPEMGPAPVSKGEPETGVRAPLEPMR